MNDEGSDDEPAAQDATRMSPLLSHTSATFIFIELLCCIIEVVLSVKCS